jgi:NhaP-type Na+/H+ or K+/H+ antiporter
MLLSFAIIIIFGLIGGIVFTKLKLPDLLGMLITGIIIGPYCLNLIDQDILNISSDIRMISLIVILLRAGLDLNVQKIKKIGKVSLKMSFIPCIIEGIIVIICSMLFLDFTLIQGGMLGFILAAVSPAVVVPMMLDIKEKGLGTDKNIPSLLLASTSVDDVFAITLFTAFMGIYFGSNVNMGIVFLKIPISIIFGIFLGIFIGIILVKIFKKFHIRDTKKTLILVAISILLYCFENFSKNVIPIASLIGIMSIGFAISEFRPVVAKRLSKKFNKVWILAKILLFVLVGATVNINVALNSGLTGLLIVVIGLSGRALGVLISTYKSDLNFKERVFCMIAYSPKATVQAAIGGVPLSMGVASGDIMLAIAVLSILFTAPLGAIGIKNSSYKLLKKEY